MSRPILWQVSGLALVSIVAVLAISFGIVLLTPTPAPPRMNVASAVEALRGTASPLRSDMARSVADGPPPGPDSPIVAAAIADELQVARPLVRAAWIGDGAAPASIPAAKGESILTIAGRDAVVRVNGNGGFTLRWGQITPLAAATPLPPFTAALRRGDGKWLIVAPRDSWLAAWRLQMLTAFLLSFSLLAPIAWLSARRITRPIRALAEAAGRIQLWKSEAAPIAGPREVRAAAEAMNAMRERLAGEAAERTRMLAAVAHDLRNPLTGLRLRAEAAAEPARGRMIADIERMERMIAEVLDYARGRERREARSIEDPAELLLGIAEEARERGQPVGAAPMPAGLAIAADRESLRRALVNLVDNALRYAGSANLALRDEGGSIALIVEDDGPGIAEAEIARLIEPFQRLETSRSRETGGAGLGLAIAHDIAVRHGGTLRLANRAGGGFRAEIRLPVFSDPAAAAPAPESPRRDRRARRRPAAGG
jgi:signal transduction histidine kinase